MVEGKINFFEKFVKNFFLKKLGINTKDKKNRQDPEKYFLDRVPTFATFASFPYANMEIFRPRGKIKLSKIQK